MSLLGLTLFFGVLSILVVTHEWGHYIVARTLGIRVERFSIGFGPILLRVPARSPEGTEFCISLIPMGGYVKLSGESADSSTGAAWEFHTRSNFHKFLVVMAGPLINALLAFVIFAGIFFVGQPSVTTKVGKVMPGFPGAAAGLVAGDRILSVNGVKVHLWEELLAELPKHRDGELWIDIERAGIDSRLDLTSMLVKQKDMFGKEHTVPRIGVMPSGEAITTRSGPVDAMVLSIRKVGYVTQLIFVSLARVITGSVSFKDSMSGPIGIYVMTQEAAKIGWVYLFDFMGRLSVSLFVINLLPIPVLDGGHLLFIGIETIFRRKISDQIKEWGLRFGMAAVLTLTVFVIYQDFIKYNLLTQMIDGIRRLIQHG